MQNASYIINADDFGLNSNVNAAVRHSFKEKWISSTTIMANGESFEEACRFAHEENMLSHVGVHLVLTEGRPLTDRIKRYVLFCDESGNFIRRHRRIPYLSSEARSVVKDEIRAQIKKCRSNGLPLTHVDSHHHIHEEWGILSLLVPLMKDYNIPYLRLMRNTVVTVSFARRLYAFLYNYKVHRLGLSNIRYFGSMSDYLGLKTQGDNRVKHNFEIMVHPVYGVSNTIVDKECNKPIAELVSDIECYGSCVSYSGSYVG